MKLRIEKTTPSHLSSICEIENASFSDPWSEKALASIIDDPLTRFISTIAEDSDKVAGYAIMRILFKEAEILNFAVSRDFRRMGIGREMMDHLLHLAQTEGAEMVFLEVRESNTAARELYGSFGFSPITKRRNYYIKPTEDAIVMYASLEKSGKD